MKFTPAPVAILFGLATMPTMIAAAFGSTTNHGYQPKCVNVGGGCSANDIQAGVLTITSGLSDLCPVNQTTDTLNGVLEIKTTSSAIRDDVGLWISPDDEIIAGANNCLLYTLDKPDVNGENGVYTGDNDNCAGTSKKTPIASLSIKDIAVDCTQGINAYCITWEIGGNKEECAPIRGDSEDVYDGSTKCTCGELDLRACVVDRCDPECEQCVINPVENDPTNLIASCVKISPLPGVCLPSNQPSSSGSEVPSSTPSDVPSGSLSPSSSPSKTPSLSVAPSNTLSDVPSGSASPSSSPSKTRSLVPSSSPSDVPSGSLAPSSRPSDVPSGSVSPSSSPSKVPSMAPSSSPSDVPSVTVAPSSRPSEAPTARYTLAALGMKCSESPGVGAVPQVNENRDNDTRVVDTTSSGLDDCYEQCASQPGCVTFSFAPGQVDKCVGCIEGSTFVNDTRFSATYDVQVFKEFNYTLRNDTGVNRKCPYNTGDRIGAITKWGSRDECAQRCRDTNDCVSFTYYDSSVIPVEPEFLGWCALCSTKAETRDRGFNTYIPIP